MIELVRDTPLYSVLSLYILFVKPTSSINKAQNTVTTDGEKTKIRVEGRHDPCVSPRAVPIAEAMVALTLIDHLMRNQFSKLK